MRRFLAKGLVVCLLCLFVPPREMTQDAPRTSSVPSVPLAAARTVPSPAVRVSQKDLPANAALLLLMTIALRGLHGS